MWWWAHKVFWGTIKPFINFHSNKVILQEGDKIITDTQEICQISNVFFTYVANNRGFDDTIPLDYYAGGGYSSIIIRHCKNPSIIKIKINNPHNDIFRFQSIVPMLWRSLIMLIAKKAQGYDRMPLKLLHKSIAHIASDIAGMISDSMTKCAFPDSLRFAGVSSLSKKKDNLNKLFMDHWAYLWPLYFFFRKSCLSPANSLLLFYFYLFGFTFSFRKGYSCRSTLLKMIEELKSTLHKGDFVACIKVDIRKAFDCLSHCLMICELYAWDFRVGLYTYCHLFASMEKGTDR